MISTNFIQIYQIQGLKIEKKSFDNKKVMMKAMIPDKALMELKNRKIRGAKVLIIG